MNKTTYAIAIIALLGLGISTYLISAPNQPVLETVVVNQSPAIPVVATVAVQSVLPVSNTATAISANEKTITWQTGAFATDQKVNINLLKKVSDSPVSYILVRKIATATANDGQEKWTPASNENESNLYIEVTCSGTDTVRACQVSGSPIRAN